MADLNEGVSLQKSVQVQLNNLAQIRNQLTFINDPQRLGRIRDRLEMMKSLGYTNNCNRRETKERKEDERKNLSEILPNAIMIHIQGKSGSAKFTKSHVVTLLVRVFEQTAPTRTNRNNELMDDLRAMKENNPDCLMESAEKFADVERVCGDAPNKATIITIGVITDEGFRAVSIQDTSSLLPMAIKMYLSNETRKKAFTKNEIIAILVGVFKHTPKKNGKRGTLLEH